MCFMSRTIWVEVETSAHEDSFRDFARLNQPIVQFSMKDDPRTFLFGKILRSSGVDELPLLINVFRGEMSLVGPRACRPYEFQKFSPVQMVRFDTVPGLTGLWQVSSPNKATFREMIELDIEYVQTRTFWLDLEIIFKTIPALLIQMRQSQMKRQHPKAQDNPKSDPEDAYPVSMAKLLYN